MNSTIEHSESEIEEEVEEAETDCLLDELNLLSASENELQTYLELIDDGLLEVLCDMLEIISSTSLRRHSALMEMKERALPLIGDVSRELIFEKWQIRIELDALKQLIMENERKINEHLQNRRGAFTGSDASTTFPRTLTSHWTP